MSIHRVMLKITLLIAAVSLCISFCLHTSVTEYGDWFENIATGIFSSAILLMISSLIGYCIEEEKVCKEYYWNLIELRSKALVLSTIPKSNNTGKTYYDAVVGINKLLTGYFATFDQTFLLLKREKIRIILDIHHALYLYKNVSLDAELYIRQYMNDIKDENGEKMYSREKLKKDIQGFINMTDNFLNEGNPFVIYLDNKIREYQNALNGKEIKSKVKRRK